MTENEIRDVVKRVSKPCWKAVYEKSKAEIQRQRQSSEKIDEAESLMLLMKASMEYSRMLITESLVQLLASQPSSTD